MRDGMVNMGMTERQAAAGLYRQMTGQAYLLASDDLFRISAVIAAALLAIVWFTRRPQPAQGPVAAD
jgi:DHA2 family multidrug resistance protein